MDKSDHQHEIASLRLLEADQLDPVRFHFIESLARRTHQHQGAVRRILETRLTAALAAYRESHEQNEARSASTPITMRDAPSPLAELARHIAQHSSDGNDAGLPEGLGSRPELKAIRQFRNTWSKLSVNQQLRDAIENAPENAGPLNSQGLALRSLALMRDISPDYLRCFMSYADSLFSLDQADKKNKPVLKRPVTAKTAKS